MHKLPIKRLPSSDHGRLLVRLNHSYRGDVDRYGIARIVNVENGRATLVLMLGHDCDDAIFMPYDIRTSLKDGKGGELAFRVEKAGAWGKLRWYLGSADPAVHIPAWIAVIALMLTAISAVPVIFGILSRLANLILN